MSPGLHSSHTNYTYTIDVFVPEVSFPEKGFPVIYILDGSSYFEFAKKIIELQCKNEAKTKVKPAIIVGINHKKETMRKQRFYDFTAPAPSYIFPERMHGREPKEVGGADDFHLFVEKELKPYIHNHYPANINNQTLFGHSLGGYYVLWNLFNHRDDFSKYIALSPSIWWNEYELTKMAESFLAQESKKEALFIGVGEMEGFMVKDAKTMHKKLSQNGVPSVFYEAAEENHASVVPSVLSRAFRYISTL